MTTPRSSLMARLVEIVTGFGAMVDVPQLLQRITEEALDLLSAYAVGIAVRDGETLTLVAGTGATPELVGRSFPVAGSAVEELLRGGRRSLSGSACSPAPPSTQQPTRPRPRSAARRSARSR